MHSLGYSHFNIQPMAAKLIEKLPITSLYSNVQVLDYPEPLASVFYFWIHTPIIYKPISALPCVLQMRMSVQDGTGRCGGPTMASQVSLRTLAHLSTCPKVSILPVSPIYKHLYLDIFCFHYYILLSCYAFHFSSLGCILLFNFFFIDIQVKKRICYLYEIIS